MKQLAYMSIGVLLGIIFMKAEITSWFRIYEMFRFESFHMYGVIGTAVILGVLQIQWFKHQKIKSFYKQSLNFTPKELGWKRYLIGGTIFGLGWGLAGACPGPIFNLIGAGFFPIIIVFIFSLIGTYFYGVFKNKLPH